MTLIYAEQFLKSVLHGMFTSGQTCVTGNHPQSFCGTAVPALAVHGQLTGPAKGHEAKNVL